MHGGIASDCPHRERSAYTGDGQVACVTVMHNFDSKNFYHKWIQDIIGAQNIETGYVPNGAPWQPGCGGGVGAVLSFLSISIFIVSPKVIPKSVYLIRNSVTVLEAKR